MLKVENLEVTYHRVSTAVQGVSLEVAEGGMVALIGNNGAGKTTTLRAISGFLGLDDARVTDGAVQFEGAHRELAAAPRRAPRRGAGARAQQGVREPERGREPRCRGRPARGLQGHGLRLFPPLAALRRRAAGYLSGGERQMLGIGSALMCAPRLLLVDELSLGLAPLVVRDLMQRLRAVREQLGTALVVEQNAQVALDVADHAYVMENGRVVLEARPSACERTRTSGSFTSAAPARGAAIATSSSTGAAAAGMAELRVDNIHLAFGGLHVLRAVSFSARPGELLALIGPNGAGKTSVLNCVSGLYRPTAARSALRIASSRA